ncbi:MAG TPA: hypothetical protein VJ725_25955 [Thermoanaerobaculia bacterium]|nr:hypothetical protein [Thermoanaerobaculia bacterium]
MTIRKSMTIERDGVLEVHDPELSAGAKVEVLIDLEPTEAAAGVGETGSGEGKPKKPVWEAIIEIGASVPLEEWDKVPRDLSKFTDHYLYGTPRQEE